jgi:hypothetical protein
LIPDVDTARKARELTMEFRARLDASIRWVLANGTSEEIAAYKLQSEGSWPRSCSRC